MTIHRITFAPGRSQAHHEPSQQGQPGAGSPGKHAAPPPPGASSAAATVSLSLASVARSNDANAVNAASYNTAAGYTENGDKRATETLEALNLKA